MSYLATYKNFMAVYTFSDDLAAYIGTVSNCKEQIIFSGRSPHELKQAFKQSVDLYLMTCRAKGRKPAKEDVGILATYGFNSVQHGFNTICGMA